MPIQLHPLLKDRVVLQRDVSVPIIGTSAPRAEVAVAFADQRVRGVADESGAFRIDLAPSPAGGPFDLLVTSESETVSVSDVLVGDVWVGSGQSNMGWKRSQCDGEHAPPPAEPDEQLRVCIVPRRPTATPTADVDVDWLASDNDVLLETSAVLGFFGQELRKFLDIPIGLINCAVGGTSIAAWTRRERLSADARFAEFLDNAPNGADDDEVEFEKATPHVDAGVDPEAAGWAAPDLGEGDGWKPMTLPVMWQAEGYAHNGAIWFRKTVEVPASWAGRDLSLTLGIVDDFDDVWFDGVHVGRTDASVADAHTRKRRYVVPGEHVKPGRRVIAVRVFDQWGQGGFNGPKPSMALSPVGDDARAISLAGEWRCKVERALPMRSAGSGIRPTVLFNGMVTPLLPMPVKGVIWYQGEADVGRAKLYEHLLKDLIIDWRTQFESPGMAFHVVQLAGFHQPADATQNSNWALMRQSQERAAELPGVGVATAVDVGDPTDIHPQRKKPVGQRLARVALNQTYGKMIVCEGPTVARADVDGPTVTLTFDPKAGRLELRTGELQDLQQAFALAGEDGVYHVAHAAIEGNTVTLTAEGVPAPKFVRYAWGDHPHACLYNGEALPAFPFERRL